MIVVHFNVVWSSLVIGLIRQFFVILDFFFFFAYDISPVYFKEISLCSSIKCFHICGT